MEEGSVHLIFMAKWNLRTRERVKGNTAFPFTIPAAPQRNRCFALRSSPAPLPAVGLTRVTRPIPGARPSGQRVKRGLNPLAARSAPEGHKNVAVVVMRENESAMAKKVEDIHRIYG